MRVCRFFAFSYLTIKLLITWPNIISRGTQQAQIMKITHDQQYNHVGWHILALIMLYYLSSYSRCYMLCMKNILFQLIYTEFILVLLCRKLLPIRNILESVPGTNQYLAITVDFLIKVKNGLSLTRFEHMFLIRRVNHSTTPQP